MKRRACYSSLFALLLLVLGNVSQAGFVVVVRPDSPLMRLSKEQVSDLYLGRVRSVVPGKLAHLLDHPRQSDTRRAFYESLLNGIPIRQVNTYWTRLQFSGEVQPPIAMPDSKSVLEALGRDPFAIGYLDISQLRTDKARVVFELKD